MSILEILLLGIGLSMDAFAVSICKGLSTKKLQFKHYLIIGAWFGGFQALMPTIGYFLGSTFEQYITAFDHWVAFVLLAAIGANMIKESFSREESETSASFAFKTMLLMALATSIDALAVGITFALLPDVNVPLAVCLIGITTFLCSAAGLRVGNLFGLRYKAKAELAGGIILILIASSTFALSTINNNLHLLKKSRFSETVFFIFAHKKDISNCNRTYVEKSPTQYEISSYIAATGADSIP